jgi:hypothetical protein
MQKQNGESMSIAAKSLAGKFSAYEHFEVKRRERRAPQKIKSTSRGKSSAVDDADAVLAAESIRMTQRAVGVILPFPVHQQAVFVLAGFQRNGLFPYAVLEFL